MIHGLWLIDRVKTGLIVVIECIEQAIYSYSAK